MNYKYVYLSHSESFNKHRTPSLTFVPNLTSVQLVVDGKNASKIGKMNIAKIRPIAAP